jgi:glycosyltransferase involved in cell wall biosynthesis
MLSVVVPTNRAGGLDILFRSLYEQTDQDFELLLVDSLKPWRAEIVKREAEYYFFPIKHLCPEPNPFPAPGYMKGLNLAIEHAEGDALLYLPDYSWVAPDCVEAHADFQRRHGKPLLLDYCYTALPPLKPSFPAGGYRHSVDPDADAQAHTETLREATERYVADLDSGKLDDLLFSLFERTPTFDEVKALPCDFWHQKNQTESPHPDYNWVSFKNESFPTELLVEMNGHDEEYDTSHGWQDSELAYRLREAGTELWSGPQHRGVVYCLNPRPVLNVKALPNLFYYNKFLCDSERVATKKLQVNPEWSMRERRVAASMRRQGVASEAP